MPGDVASTDQAVASWNNMLDKYIQGFRKHAERDGTNKATLALGQFLMGDEVRKEHAVNLLVVAIRRMAG